MRERGERGEGRGGAGSYNFKRIERNELSVGVIYIHEEMNDTYEECQTHTKKERERMMNMKRKFKSTWDASCA